MREWYEEVRKEACKDARIQTCKDASMQACKHARMQSVSQYTQHTAHTVPGRFDAVLQVEPWVHWC